MNKPKLDIPKDVLADLYLTQRLSLTQIAKRFAVNHVTISNYLRKEGIQRRTPADALATDLSNKIIGDWVVTDEKDRSTGHLKWKCLCKKCNNYHWVLARSLYSGTSTMCLQCRIKLRRKGYEQLTGTQWKKICDAAALRNIPVEITIKDAWELFQNQDGHCALSGIKLVFGYKSKATASLDRIDNRKGYLQGNVQWVHKDLNRMKWKHSQEEFVRLCQAVAKHQSMRNT